MIAVREVILRIFKSKYEGERGWKGEIIFRMFSSIILNMEVKKERGRPSVRKRRRFWREMERKDGRGRGVRREERGSGRIWGVSEGIFMMNEKLKIFFVFLYFFGICLGFC